MPDNPRPGGPTSDHGRRPGLESMTGELVAVRSRRGLVTAVASILAALLAGGALVVELVDSDGDRVPDGARVIVQRQAPPPSIPAEVKVDGPDADGKLDDTLTTDPAGRDAVGAGLESGQSELTAPLRQPGDTAATTTTTIPGPLAADEVPGCRTRFVGNSSSRNGTPVRLIWLHQTVSHEFGWSSQNALTALAARRSSGVSWHLLVGRTSGRCTYTVPLALKAWTQSNGNPSGVGIEVEGYGNEGAYVAGGGKAKLVSVVRYVARRFGIPLQRGRVDRATCRPLRAGIVEHSDGGPCAGGHVDVTLAPSDAASYIAAAAARATASSSSRPRSSTERARCGALRHHRQAVRRGAKWSDTVDVRGKHESRGRRARYLKSALRRAHVDEARYCA